MLVVWSFPPSRTRRIAVFDLDGVVVDSEARLRAALEAVGAEGLGGLRGAARRRFWEVFLSEGLLGLDRPNPAGRGLPAGHGVGRCRRGVLRVSPSLAGGVNNMCVQCTLWSLSCDCRLWGSGRGLWPHLLVLGCPAEPPHGPRGVV